ncbi:hypothetical protein ABVF61_20935 [Roseibium sp. HPY-6]|uniref:nSTAND1 domain-containing NTPase n=1 Tax=Roseibium sp. HPY-6 TaxID=3229852 RepID=UPI00338FD1A2
MSQSDPLQVYASALLNDEESDGRLGPSPYQGLRFFDQRTNPLQVAREQSSKQIRKRFEQEQTVAVVGGSGSGKSSIVRGRVISEISSGTFPVKGRSGAWHSVVFRPATKPFTQFRDAIWDQVFADTFRRSEGAHPDPIAIYIRNSLFGAEVTETEARRIVEADLDGLTGAKGEGRNDSFAAAQIWIDAFDAAYSSAWLSQSGADHYQHDCEGEEEADEERTSANVLFLIDQFEEVFREKVDDVEATALYDMIRYVHTTKPPGVFLVITMRSEDLHRCTQVPDLPDLINDSFYLVEFLDREGLKSAIIEPARRVLREWRVPMADTPTAPYQESVVDNLLDQVERMKKRLGHSADHLPLFQHGLTELWRNAVKEWSRRPEAEQTGPFEITEDHLNALIKRSGTESRWFSGVLKAVASNALTEAKTVFDKTEGARTCGVTAKTAIRAALCEMASLEENRRYHREFVRVSEVLEKRFPFIQGKARTALQNAVTNSLETFCQRGLLVRTHSRHDEPSFDVMHEALIRNWSKLDRWVTIESEIRDAIAMSIDRDGVKINEDNMSVLAKVCAPKSVARHLTEEDERYLSTFTNEWITDAIERSGSYKYFKFSVSPMDIFDSLKAAWRRKQAWIFARAAAIPGSVGVLILCGAIVLGLFAKIQQAEAEAELAATATKLAVTEANVRNAISAREKTRARALRGLLLANKRGAVNGQDNPLMAARTLAVSYQALRYAMEHQDMQQGMVPERTLLRTHSELDGMFQHLMGATLHVVSTPSLDHNRDWPEPECVSIEHSEGAGVDLSKLTSSVLTGGGLQLTFAGRDEYVFEARDESSVAAVDLPVLETSSKLPRFEFLQQICLSPDGQVMTIVFRNNVAPSVYILREMATYRFYESKEIPQRYLKVMPINSPTYFGDVFSKKSKMESSNSTDFSKAAKVTGISEVLEKPWKREIVFEYDGDPYKAFFYEGRYFPVTVSESARGKSIGEIDESEWYSSMSKASGRSETMEWCWSETLASDDECRMLSSLEEEGKRTEIFDAGTTTYYKARLNYTPPGFNETDQIIIYALLNWRFARLNGGLKKIPIPSYKIILRRQFEADETDDGAESGTVTEDFELGTFQPDGITDLAIKKENGAVLIAFESLSDDIRVLKVMEPVSNVTQLIEHSLTDKYQNKVAAKATLVSILQDCKNYQCGFETISFIEAEIAKLDKLQPKP